MKLLQRKLLKPIVPVLKITGTINEIKAEYFIRSLRKLDTNRAVALAVCVNSPGGTPAQAEMITTQIKNFVNKRQLKLLTFTSDHALSAGYSILCMGDQIYADKTSLIGSIGVLWKKHTALNVIDALGGTYYELQSQKSLKTILNPFKQVSNEQREFLKMLSNRTHQKFISWVKDNRGNKLNLANSEYLFSGAALTAEQALQNGLIDGLGSVTEILTQKYPNAEIYYHKLVVQKLYSLNK